MPELLLELFCEEIPARMQAGAAADLERLLSDGLGRANLGFSRIRSFVTPRRLTVVVEGLPERQPDVTEERKGPRVGSPEAAVQGFLKASGLASIEAADVRETEKGRFYFAIHVRTGRPTSQALVDVLRDAIAALPWPKSMRWGHSDVRWVRPLHNVLAYFDHAPLELSIALVRGASDPADGTLLVANNRTYGHRFMAPNYFEVHSFGEYQAKLRAAKVIVDPAERRSLIEDGALCLARNEGLTVKADSALLDEVTGLVEWPVVMMGRIDQAFMELPPEVLATAMRAHQKYFALLDGEGRLAPRFVVVANTETKDGGSAVVAGNERVLRARLSDAKFFWEQDRRQALEAKVDRLAERVFHARLGSDLDRVRRLEVLARAVAPIVDAKVDAAGRAARLCKADLMSGMVGEFPELQGTMGRYYALHEGEPAEVADAIADHYSPLGPSDRCPAVPVSVAVSLADKVDILAGFFAIGEKPTGSGDPFALRRAALGVIRIIIENRLRLGLRTLFAQALALYPEAVVGGRAPALVGEILAFFADRLKVHLREAGVRHDLVSAVFAGGAEDDLVKLLARVDALRDFLNTEDGANLLTAFRRASNIVRIEENKDGARYEGEAEPALLAEREETNLHRTLTEARGRIGRALAKEHFGEAMGTLAGLRQPVDAFFDHVTVNCQDAGLRANRLKLLSQIRSALGGVADFSLIEG
jgi:glycyl-tRNA synthetase beta chain